MCPHHGKSPCDCVGFKDCLGGIDKHDLMNAFKKGINEADMNETPFISRSSLKTLKTMLPRGLQRMTESDGDVKLAERVYLYQLTKSQLYKLAIKHPVAEKEP